MNITRAALLAAVLAAPAFAADPAPAVTAAEAEAAVATAAGRAEEAAKRVSSVPVEFARALLVIAYADETGDKAAYWTSAAAALKAEAARLDAEIEEMSRAAYNGIDDAIMRSMKLARTRWAAELVAADAAMDAATLADPSKEDGRAIIDRKAELFRRLAQLKPRP